MQHHRRNKHSAFPTTSIHSCEGDISRINRYSFDRPPERLKSRVAPTANQGMSESMPSLPGTDGRSHIASTARRRPPRRTIFWIALAFVLVTIAAVVLLANNKRHLQSLAVFLGIPFDQQARPAERRPDLIRPVHAKGGPIALPLHLLDQPRPALAGALIGLGALTGQQLCDSFRNQGIDIGAWQTTEVDARLSECYFESTITTSSDTTLFLAIRDSSLGGRLGIYLKLATPEAEAFDPAALRFVKKMMESIRWGGCTDVVNQIVNRDGFSINCYGTAITFSREVLNPNNFNLLISRQAQSDEQQRTLDFYFGKRWLRTVTISSEFAAK